MVHYGESHPKRVASSNISKMQNYKIVDHKHKSFYLNLLQNDGLISTTIRVFSFNFICQDVKGRGPSNI